MATLPLTLPFEIYWRSWRAWCAAKKNEHLRTLLKRAKANLRTCIAQNEKRLIFPELFSPTTPPPRSPLYWNATKYTKRDLIELITALEAINAIVGDNNKPSSFIEIVSSFESLLNISISNPYKERDLILTRKKCVTGFTDRLVRVVIEKSATK